MVLVVQSVQKTRDSTVRKIGSDTNIPASTFGSFLNESGFKIWSQKTIYCYLKIRLVNGLCFV